MLKALIKEEVFIKKKKTGVVGSHRVILEYPEKEVFTYTEGSMDECH